MSTTATDEAFAGGDTSPATKAEIAAKNTAMQAYLDEQVAAAVVKEDARVQYENDMAAAEATAAATQSLMTGAAAGQPDVPSTNPPVGP
jgi:hypothetical protein